MSDGFSATAGIKRIDGVAKVCVRFNSYEAWMDPSTAYHLAHSILYWANLISESASEENAVDPEAEVT